MTATWLDGPDDADFQSRARDAEDDLCGPPVCPRCGGSGEGHHLEHPPDPQTRVDYPCPHCGGTGVLDPRIDALFWTEHEVDQALEQRGEGSW